MATFTYTNYTGITIPDNGRTSQSLYATGIINPTVLSGQVFGKVTDVSVSLYGLTHASPDDLDMLLVAPDGTHNLEFFSDAGGSAGVSNANFTIRDNAATPPPDAGMLAPGSSYKPSDYDAAETDSNFGSATGGIHHAAASGTISNFGSSFDGLTKDAVDGNWNLYIADDSGGNGGGSLTGWGMTITTDEPLAFIRGTSGNDTIQIVASGGPDSDSGSFSINEQNVTFTGVGRDYSLFVDGGDGDDTINGSDAYYEVISGGAGRDTIHAGASGDAIDIGAGQDVAGEVYDGGGGYDTLGLGYVVGSDLNTNYTIDLRDDTVSSIEELTFAKPAPNGTATVMINAAQISDTGISTTATVSDGFFIAKSLTFAVTMDTATFVSLSGFVFKNFADPGDRVMITGDNDAETITGSSVNDIINGKGGADTLTGLGGNDTYFVDNAGDKVYEAAGAGTDRIVASLTYTIAAGQEVERIEASTTASTFTFNLTGNEFANTLLANNGSSTLNGGGGNDTLKGYLGNDSFYFNTALDASKNVDHIVDFQNVAGDNDQILINNAVFTKVGADGALAGVAFYAGTAAHDADDRIIYDSATGNLFYDADGNKAGGVDQIKFAVIDDHASLSGATALTAADFLVV